MKNRRTVIDVTPVRQELVSPAEFVRLNKESPHLISRSRFVTPKVGGKDFGMFEVQYAVPFLKRPEVA